MSKITIKPTGTIILAMKVGIGFLIKIVIGFVIELYLRTSLLRINSRAVQQLSAHGYVQEHTSVSIYISLYIFMDYGIW